MIDLKLLSLLKIVERGSYTKAALELGLTQPAISTHIKQLESELNIKIFNRTKSGLKPTLEGEILIKYARRIQSLYKELNLKLSDEKKYKRSYVIGITHTSESNLIAEILANYLYKHDEVKIKVKSDSIKNLYEKLSTYEIDFAFIDSHPSKKYSSILLDSDYLVAVVNKEHPLARKGVISIEELKKEKMILRSSSSETRNLFIAALGAQNISFEDFNIVMEIDNIATIKDLISFNPFVSVLPRSACYSHNKNLALLRIENLDMIRELSIIYPKDFIDIKMLNELTHLYQSAIHKG